MKYFSRLIKTVKRYLRVKYVKLIKIKRYLQHLDFFLEDAFLHLLLHNLIVTLLYALSEGLGFKLELFMLPLNRLVVQDFVLVNRFQLRALGFEHLLHKLHLLLLLFEKLLSLREYGLFFFDKGVLLFELASEVRIALI
jgi:hypothetical protein